MRVAVTVDDREPASLVDRLRDHGDVESVAVSRLSAGDVLVEERAVGIERKTPRDFARSALGSRGTDLREQVERLSATVEHPYVLVEGDLPAMEAATGLVPASLRGAMASLMARTGVPVVPVSDQARLADLAVRLGRKHLESPSPRALPPSAVRPDEPPAKRMYGCIEGIGPELAGNLHEAFPTVASLVGAGREELLAVEGIGERRARAVREALGSADVTAFGADAAED